MATLESAFGVNTVHRDVVAMLFSSWHVFLQTPFHLNYLISGPPASNKSHRLILLMMFLLAETFKKWTYTTPKAKTATGDEEKDPTADKQYICLTEIYEDVPPSVIGVTDGSKSSVGTDTDAILKGILTSGYISFNAWIKDENGNRTSVIKTVDVRSGENLSHLSS